MERRTLIIVLVVLIVVAVGIWAWWLRAQKYPKEYTGEQPAGPGAPMQMEQPFGVGGGQTPAKQQPQVQLQ